MKQYTYFKGLLHLSVLVAVVNLPLAVSQICEYSDGSDNVAFTTPDNVEDNTIVWSGKINKPVTSVSFGFPDTHPGSLLTYSFEEVGEEEFEISLLAKQPDLGDALDYHGYAGDIGPTNGLIIEYNGGRCTNVLRPTITDTNNRAPQFNRTGILEFTINTAWLVELPLNWDTPDQFQATDYDFTKSDNMDIDLEVVGGEGTLLKATFTERPGVIENAFVFDVKIFVDGPLVIGTHVFDIRPDDGVNKGDSIRVILVIEDLEDVDRHEPRFRSEQYYEVLELMPGVGDRLTVSPEAYDPDDEMKVGNFPKSTFVYTVDHDGVDEFLEFEIGTNKLVVTADVPTNAGKQVQVKLIGIEDVTGKTAESVLTVVFPPPETPKFAKELEWINLDWPIAGFTHQLDPATGPGLIKHEFLTSPPTDAEITIDETTGLLTFNKDLDKSVIGELKDNNVMMFSVKACNGDFPGMCSVASFVVTFPPDEEVTTTTTEGTTQEVTECPTTSEPTCPPCSTEPTSTQEPCDCSTTTTDCPSTPNDSSTCAPCTTDPTSTPEPCDCTSTITTECPSTPPDSSTCAPCPTDPPSTDCPSTPPDSSTCAPCDCTSTTTPDSSTCAPCPTDPTCTTEPCDCTSTITTECPSTPPDSSTCAPCPTDPACTPEPCDYTTTTSTECPITPEPCDCTSTTLNPPECNTTTHIPTTCPPCPTGPTECPPTTPPGSTCPPTTCPPTTPPGSTCPPPSCPTTTTPEPCDCDSGERDPCYDKQEDDCSNTGLVVGVITTSVLCAASMLAGGYCLWLLRKATVNPTTFQRNSFLTHDNTSLISRGDMEPKPTSEYTRPNRFSFGGGTSMYNQPITETGVTNPNFTNDTAVPIAKPLVPPQTSPDPLPSTIPQATPSIKPPKEIEPDYDDLESTSQEPQKKTNLKTPKEIEPDYEEFQPKISTEASTAKQSRIQFAPEAEYISIDENGGLGEVASISDVEDERL